MAGAMPGIRPQHPLQRYASPSLYGLSALIHVTRTLLLTFADIRVKLTLLVPRPCLLHILLRLSNRISYTNKRLMGLALPVPYNHWPLYHHCLFHSWCLGRPHIISSSLPSQEHPCDVLHSFGSPSRHAILESQVH